jgi:hypothetical protein
MGEPAPLESGLTWHRAIDTSLASAEDFAEPGREVPLELADHCIANPRTTVIVLAQGSRVERRPGVVELAVNSPA